MQNHLLALLVPSARRRRRQEQLNLPQTGAENGLCGDVQNAY